MVVTLANSSGRFVAVPESVASGRGRLVRFTVADVLSMIRTGVIVEGSPTELLGGLIVDKDRSERGGDPVSHGLRHRKSVRKLAALSARIDSPERHVQSQLPLVCGEDEMPEPDFAVVRGTDDDYDDAHPVGTDACCVIEVADSSLERDRDEKRSVYATAGVPVYGILNLRTDVLTVYADADRAAGTYRSTTTLTRGDTFAVPLGGGQTLDVPVADVLP